MTAERIIIGLDPGLRHTGWGLINSAGSRLSFIAAGRISPPDNLPMSLRLLRIAEDIAEIAQRYAPNEAAIEETFVNKNARSALLLGQARGVAICAFAREGLAVTEYAANRIKQSVTGYGHADKTQIQAMVAMLLPGSGALAADAADALAVAITHAHHSASTFLKRIAL